MRHPASSLSHFVTSSLHTPDATSFSVYLPHHALMNSTLAKGKRVDHKDHGDGALANEAVGIELVEGLHLFVSVQR